MNRFGRKRVVVCAFAAVLWLHGRVAHAQPFDFDTGNSAIQVIIPAVIPALFQTTAPNDAPIILRHTTLIINAWFDAIAPYHPTAVGVYSRLGRRPAVEGATKRNKNIAMFWGGVHFLPSISASQEMCRPIGNLAFEFVDRHIRGDVP